MLRAHLFLHPEWGFSCALRLQVEEQSLLVLRRRLLLWRLDLLPNPLLCPVRPADSSVRKSSPARVDVAVDRQVVGPAELVKDDLGNTPLPLFALLAAGRLPIGLLLVLLKKIELSRLLTPSDVCLEVHPAIPVPLRRATARLVLALRVGGRGLPPRRIGITRALAVICSHLLRVRQTMTVLVALDSLDIDRDDSFWSVLALIRKFHSLEEPAGVPSARCKTSLASIYGLMSETSPAFHQPTSPCYGHFWTTLI